MKKIILISLGFVFCISSLFSETIEKNFNVIFRKGGISSVTICNLTEEGTVDRDSFLDRIDFSLWDGTTIPYAKFGIAWNVYSGSRYSIMMSCYAFDGSREHNMIYDGVPAEGEDPYLDYQSVTITRFVGAETPSVNYEKGIDFKVYEGIRNDFSEAAGEAIVHLTMEAMDDYLGDYDGYIYVELKID